jgi:hypothetical protein
MSDCNPKFIYLYCRWLPGLAWASWGSFFFETGLIKDASVNILTETVVLEKSPRLIDINQGGSVMLPVSVNRFYETVIFNRSG